MKKSKFKNQNYTFGLITTVKKAIFRSAYHREILAGLFDAIGKGGHELKLLIFKPGRYRRLEDVLRRYPAVDGFFMIAWRWFDPALTKLIQKAGPECPVLLFNDFERGLRTNILYTDPAEGIRKAVDYLVKKKFKRIGAILGPPTIPFVQGGRRIQIPFVDAEEKARGFQRAIQEKRLNWKEQWCLRASAYTVEEGRRLTQKMIRRSSRPEAIVCGNDDLAIGALQAMREKGLRVPQDMAVTGFDNTEKAAWVSPPLTTMAQPLAEMGWDAVKFLVRRFETGHRGRICKEYPTRLVIRHSV